MESLKSLTIFVFESIVGRNIAERVQARRWVSHLKSEADHEPEIELFRQFLEPGQIAIDVGGYGAAYTYAMSQTVGPTGAVYVFEPLPRYVRVLQRVISNLQTRNVVVVEAALADSSGVASLTYATARGRSLVGEVHITSEQDTGLTVTVDTATLDGFAAPQGLTSSIQAIKVDIEGAELMMLRGAAEVLKRSRPLIVCEIEERHCARYGHSVDAVFTAFDELGYSRHRYDNVSHQLAEWAEGSLHNNHVFIHRSKVSEAYKQVNG